MEKRSLSPLELLNIATQHAYCAEHLLEQNASIVRGDGEDIDALYPVITLMYKAFFLTFKAYALHENRPIKQYKNLRELVELNQHLGFSSRELALLKTLSQQQAFTKGLEYDLWENPQQLHVFCEQILDLYERVQQLMPLELQKEYQ
ncbi:hypothetical protein [Legionella israelensis]|uniref:Nucleotidyltransferase n=1 Tax=Legionella israelensis TaxID=454 RepID=A0A0W0WQJ5_9GAMM|nr:hypothetical protein [Legionella israelensis]KTD34573.1 hypothetical protein Lisr_0117 [Legionella israelensis]QBS09496.1 hypothetical protein E4T55_06270 [Legionella israelensis]SCX99742.1 hypothetical protein SAMN02746069_00933 [Legionella israelensis DSM 19235]STX60407.1 Uncharacterised protein [Legionella israelensis]